MTIRLMDMVLLLPVAWGVLAFGGVYPWAYWSLAVACVVASIIVTSRTRQISLRPGLLFALALVVLLAGSLQLIPLPVDLLARISPATIDLLNRSNVVFASGGERFHSISIDPGATTTTLFLFIPIMAMVIGVTRWASWAGVRGIATGLAILGIFVALVGIIQKPLFAGKIYGLWTPYQAGSPFGPFVNRNHFAGWMMMCLPICMALVMSLLETARPAGGRRVDWRAELAWLNTKGASQLMLLAAGCAVMALALVLTLSRSGIAAFVLSMAASAALLPFGRTRRSLGVMFIAALFVSVVVWAGAGTLVARFDRNGWHEFNDRRGAWDDAEAVATSFPLVGTGLNTYGTAMLFYQKHNLEEHYAQAHNDYLQIAAEGGALLVIPSAILAVAILSRIVRRFGEAGSPSSWWIRAGAVTGLFAFLLQESVDFSFQMPGNAVMFAVLLGLALHRSPRMQTKKAA